MPISAYVKLSRRSASFTSWESRFSAAGPVAREKPGWQSRWVVGDADEIAREEEELVADRVGKMAHDLLVLGDTDRGQVVVELLKRLERIEAAPTAPSAPGATAPVTV